MITITKDNFQEVISQNLALIDVWASWCGPCKQMNPVLDSVAQEMGDKVQIGKISAETDMELAQSLGVRAIPAFFLYKNGEIVEKWTGIKSKANIIQLIEKHS